MIKQVLSKAFTINFHPDRFSNNGKTIITLCTSDTFAAVLVDIFKDVKSNCRMLNQVIASEQETLAVLFNSYNKPKHIGRNLDYCIETHIHGDISLKDDVESFYMDESFQGTTFAILAESICQKYNIELNWIPKRQVNIHSIGELFRGPKIPFLAQRTDEIFGGNQGIINSFLIGQASRDIELYPEKWAYLGNEAQLFQYIKQIWHTVGYFG